MRLGRGYSPVVEDIKITAEPDAAGRSCKFVIDRPILEGTAYIASDEMATHSPLAQRLLAIAGIKSVLMGGNLVTVSAQSPLDDWRSTAKQAAVQIRDHIRSGKPAVLESYRTAGGSGSAEAGIRRKITETLESRINPAIAAHGGSINLIDVRGTVVFIQMAGGCQGCASSTATLKLGVENAIRDVAPEVTDIVDVTDHAAGVNPYYAKQ